MSQKKLTWARCALFPKGCHIEQFATSSYVDVNGKEWIVLLGACRLNKTLREEPTCDSFLYDVADDKFIPFINNYNRELNQRFNIKHSPQMGYQSFVIDNSNHILYWFDADYAITSNKVENVRHNVNIISNTTCSIITLDMKNLNNIKLINQTIINRNQHPGFRHGYTMFLIGNTIHFENLGKDCIISISIMNGTVQVVMGLVTMQKNYILK